MLGILTNIHDIYALLPESYSGGISVVFIIAFSKYFDVMLGNNNSIIFNSKYYRTVLFLGLCLVVVTVTLNRIFIPLYGITGAAWATLISIGLYSLAKALFVVLRMKLFPFTIKTLGSVVILAATFILFYPWTFGIHPVINILLKSVLITLMYLGLHFYTKISSDINEQLTKYLPFLKAVLK